jgi:hypothetical protein
MLFIAQPLLTFSLRLPTVGRLRQIEFLRERRLFFAGLSAVLEQMLSN